MAHTMHRRIKCGVSNVKHNLMYEGEGEEEREKRTTTTTTTTNRK